ncbi:conserved hypothetical protein [Bosea sp. 62]|nr:conserved hypothetical protein [Bosea sp. 7B]CAD5277357.1 conserved hypothetical protein [Bosea sp. 21B]CAD5278418.1 conserved hypothetical protein [Bosea sp. 46]VVT59778.1 conserved hypothetical protein [Bosea sp. EC-HK365B]VXB42947.1 conserved hypothetical protein [Bosea sp. 62]VXC04591.1 conserved hypothetical protein [Bosea sp. 127]VXC26012.1 conserved hypothetical protein [Bosea sp. 29B]VXC76881.1 conserved hypothetical protein [Bosea sp. 125]
MTMKTSQEIQNAAAGPTRSAATLAVLTARNRRRHNRKSRIMSTHKPRHPAHRSASFHDASAREAYASRFRPIAIPAILAGTRWTPAALTSQHRDVPALLRNGFED